ncbi:hypothetical protein AB0F72_13385, partial [Actinoplanes sp. NPDC023936]|uniref:hypothetical protein n=1 Tax=Actinoplanes sp. NPDC023936 TaxID=3154910 RepID=UPI0033EFDE12
WHWLFKHPVEFSKNNRTPSFEPLSRPAPGALVQLYSLVFRSVKSAFQANFTARTPVEQPAEHYTTLGRDQLSGFWQDGRCAGP